MKTISIINLKGGVGKTISAINIAHIMATVHNKRVLLVDNEKQGNISQMFGLCDYNKPSISEILTERNVDISTIISSTRYLGLDVIPANMNLVNANFALSLEEEDKARPRYMRLRTALESVKDDYDYCVIDNPPDINISTINALVASDDVLIPIKIDKFAFDGLTELTEQISNIKEGLNSELALCGCFVTMFQNNDVNRQGETRLRQERKYHVFNTHIRKTEKVDQSTFEDMPILEYSKRCGAARDYLALVAEYLSGGRV